MSSDFADAREAPATLIGYGRREAPETDDDMQPSDVADAEVIDADAVIIEDDQPRAEQTPRTADGLASDAAGEPEASAAEGPAPDAELADDDADDADDAELMHERWAAIQSTFVDDPRGSVTAAADLVGEAIGTLVANAKQRERGLRGEWDRDGVDTEGLRQALRNYRGFLDRITAV
jgi:hypothetical protein